MSPLTRQELLAATAGGAVGLALGGAGGFFAGDADAAPASHNGTVPFYGAKQAGITTPAQDRLVFGSFDLTTNNPREVAALLRAWTTAAVLMSEGQPLGDAETVPAAPPIDTGEAVGLPAANLTLTFGFGESVFAPGRFGLEHKKPALLHSVGSFPFDDIDPEISDGDICVQACSDDPQVAFHAVRNLARLGRGTAVVRWMQLGFGRTSSTTSAQETPRNLQGFKDGTNNLDGDNTADMDEFVWVPDHEPQSWLRGGSYMVTRRIRMRIEIWDHSSLADQEQTIGRFKTSGAPLTGTKEHDEVDFTRRDSAGEFVVPLDAHIRLARPKANRSEAILRRGYSFTDGIDPETGELDAGLFFIAYQKDPHLQFAAIQRRLGEQDALNEYIEHTSNGLFAVPPGIKKGQFVGENLFS